MVRHTRSVFSFNRRKTFAESLKLNRAVRGIVSLLLDPCQVYSHFCTPPPPLIWLIDVNRLVLIANRGKYYFLFEVEYLHIVFTFRERETSSLSCVVVSTVNYIGQRLNFPTVFF